MEELTLEQKFAKLLLDLRSHAPFYSVIYESVEKIETDSIETVGVTANTMLYNAEFLGEKQYPELVFIILHEILHLVLLHPVRVGTKDKVLYNRACDLYVNKLICEEFDTSGVISCDRLNITKPDDVLYNEGIDTDTDTVESIYNELYKQTGNNGWHDNSYNGCEFKLKANGLGRDGCYKKVFISKKDSGEFIDDAKDNVQRENEAKRLLSEVNTKLEMNGSMGIGSSANKIKKHICEMLKSHIDWRKILSKYCIKLHQKDTSFKRIDQRMLYQEAIYPGNYDEGQDSLAGVKICIDTSASISTKDLKYMLYHIDRITTMYKTDAEIVCWDTEVESTYDIDSVEGIFKKGLSGFGGTDPASVFKYLDSKECKVKPIVTLIFTDGYFDIGNFKKEWARRYKNTYWIITKQGDDDFSAPFGKVTRATYE